MSRYKTDVLHTVKSAYRILEKPLYARTEKLAKENGISTGTQFNFLVRDMLNAVDTDSYEPSEKALLYFPNMVIKLDRKQITLYLSPSESDKLGELQAKTGIDKAKLVTSLLTDALVSKNAL